MKVQKFYYRFKPIAIDWTSERDIKKYNRQLISFEELSQQFLKLKEAYENLSKERADIMINMIPDVCGIVELSVYHHIKYKLFSHIIKKNCYSLCITKFDFADNLDLFFCDMDGFDEVELIFKDLIEKQSLPDLDKWRRTLIK